MKSWDYHTMKRVIAENAPEDEIDERMIRCYNRALLGELLIHIIPDEQAGRAWTGDEIAAVLMGYAIGQYERGDDEYVMKADKPENEPIH